MITNNFIFRIGKKESDIRDILEDVQTKESASAWVKRAIREKAKKEKTNEQKKEEKN